MGYTLLWLESLCAALLFLATVTASAAHSHRFRIQKIVPIFIGLAMVILVGLVTALVGVACVPRPRRARG